MIAPNPQRMRKINTSDFQLATRSTPREINRQIVLNLIRESQPISRAELARRMGIRRGALTAIVRELIETGDVYEQGTAAAVRGRRPTLLGLQTSGRHVLAVDVRPEHTAIALADFSGRMVARDVVETPRAPESLGDLLDEHIGTLLEARATAGSGDGLCHGIGLVVPGMVDRRTGHLLYSPRLGWRDVPLRDTLAARLGLPVHVESAPIACALARLWLSPDETRGVHSFAYVSVSDGVGVGLVVAGETLRGDTHTAGEFGHVTLDPAGPPCACGRRGCWEAFACNSATVARYTERVWGARAEPAGRSGGRRAAPPPVEEVVRRARGGEEAAVATLVETGRYIGRGLATVVSAFNPGRIFVGGEVTGAWDLIERPIREALVEGTLTDAARATPVIPDREPAAYRLLGAVALVAAPAFAAPSVG